MKKRKKSKIEKIIQKEAVNDKVLDYDAFLCIMNNDEPEKIFLPKPKIGK